MTNPELNNEFDLLYSNNANVGPGLDIYDKSVLLTRAQEEILNAYYGPKNAIFGGFEYSEKRRRDLDKLSVPAISSNPTQDTYNISPNAYYFTLEDDVRFIINERLTISSTDNCLNGNSINVEPITHDEYNLRKDDPFSNPDKDTAWRMDINNGTNSVEIVGGQKYTPVSYHYRYIKKPNPIVLDNLDPGLSIDGVSTSSECELQIIVRDILDRAVEIALETSSNPRTKSKLAIDARNE